MCLELDALIVQEMMEELAIPEELKDRSEETVPEIKELVTV